MPPSPENNEQSSIQQAADQHAEEILARRRESRARRAAALAVHPRPLSIKTELTQLPLAAAVAPAPVSTTAQTAGYLLAVGDSWFDYPIHDILTRLDDNYGYNIESSAHRGDPIETMVSSVGQLDKLARCMDKIVALGATPTWYKSCRSRHLSRQGGLSRTFCGDAPLDAATLTRLR